ncbi:MAG: tyrosine-type recombinase/integrase, partial [Polyangiaceae bacterium]
NQTDIDFKRNQLTVQRSIYQNKEVPPKGNKSRVIPMTDTLAEALQQHRHLRGPRVLYRDDGTQTTPRKLRMWMEQIQRRAGMEVTGELHKLRHSFCSFLAMKNAPVRTIQALAGHSNLMTTLRYMHLSSGACHEAIALLNKARTTVVRGDIVETGAKQ